MALHHAVSGEKIPLQRGDNDIAHFTSVALVKTEHMELIRLVLPVERPIPEHRVDGEVTIVCLEGSVAVDAHGTTTELQPSEMVWLEGGTPHTVRATTDAVALMTILMGPNRPAGQPTSA